MTDLSKASGEEPRKGVKKRQSREATYLAIGRFIAHFSELEGCLRWTVEAALGGGNIEHTEMIVQLLDYSTLCNAAKAYLLRIDKGHRAPDEVIKKTINLCLEMGVDRNKIAHGSWPHQEQGVKHMSRQSLTEAISFKSIEELRQLSANAAKLSSEVLDLYIFYIPKKEHKAED